MKFLKADNMEQVEKQPSRGTSIPHGAAVDGQLSVAKFAFCRDSWPPGTKDQTCQVQDRQESLRVSHSRVPAGPASLMKGGALWNPRYFRDQRLLSPRALCPGCAGPARS